MKNTYEVDNLNKMQKSPTIFFRYTIQMLTFLVSIYIVHLNFSIVNALLALLLLVIVEMFLEIIENSKYSIKTSKIGIIKQIGKFIDRNFHYVILMFAFCIRLYVFFKLKMLPYDSEGIFVCILNCVFTAIISLFIYLISKELFSKRTGQILAILYSISIVVSVYCNITTNHHVFSVLVLLSIYLLISKRYTSMNYLVKHSIIAVLLAVASFFRLEGIIYLLAVVLYLFANSLVKNNGKKEKLISIALIILIYILVNVLAFGLIKIMGLNNKAIEHLTTYKEMLGKSKTSIEQFEINQKDYWNNINYEFVSDELNMEKIRNYDSVIFLFCAINAAIIVIYCKMKNIEDERMYLLYLIILINFFVYGFIKDNSMYSYVAKIIMFILASGGLAIFKKNAEMEAMEKYNVKLLQE